MPMETRGCYQREISAAKGEAGRSGLPARLGAAIGGKKPVLAGAVLLVLLGGAVSPAHPAWHPAPPAASPPAARGLRRSWKQAEPLGTASLWDSRPEPALSSEDLDREFRRWQGILRRYPSRLDPHLGLGEIYFRAGNDLAARHHLELYLAAAPCGPDSFRAAVLHARTLVRLDRTWDATVALEALARRRDAPAGVSHDLAVLLQRDRRMTEALAAEMRAVERSGGDPQYLRAAAFQWKDQGYAAEARRLFDLLCATGKAEGEDQFQRGYLAHCLGEPAAARPAYEAALALDPDHAEAHYNLGLVLAGEKDHDGSAREFREVIRLRPAYEPTYFELGSELLHAGRRVDAARVFRDYVRIGTDGYAVLEAAGILNALAPDLSDSLTAIPQPVVPEVPTGP
jgi:tetratricopeptide (TPR) repeat protein